MAGDAIPVRQLDVGAALAVGMQHLGNEQKEIEQPTFAEGPADRRPAVALAELLVANMGMRVFVPLGGRIGIEGLYLIGGGRVQFLPRQPNTKPAQIDVVEHDPIGGDRDRFFLQIDLDVLELVG